MMGERQVDRGVLFYEFSLEEHVPSVHMLRSIDRFVDLSEVRQHLAAKGYPMSPEAIYERICLRTLAAFGQSINPHLYRDCAATTIALLDPKHVMMARYLLGHSDSISPSGTTIRRRPLR